MKFQVFFQLQEKRDFSLQRNQDCPNNTFHGYSPISHENSSSFFYLKKCVAQPGEVNSLIDKINMPWSLRGIPDQKHTLLKEILKRT